MPKSAPAAPAVAKKPITMASVMVNATKGLSCPAGTWYRPTPPAVWKKTISSMSSGMAFRSSETFATYRMPLAPTHAMTQPHSTPVAMNGPPPGWEFMPRPLSMNSLATDVATANQPICNSPMSSPGMR